ncbi:UNVERIFIED_CONTAM: hypothetical protein B566_EDAN017951 [Ephemera danica]|nr:hypothetical protein B566_EDAN017951 [Ephemera danica]
MQIFLDIGDAQYGVILNLGLPAPLHALTVGFGPYIFHRAFDGNDIASCDNKHSMTDRLLQVYNLFMYSQHCAI